MELHIRSKLKKDKASLMSKIIKKIEKLVPTDIDDDIQVMVTEIQNSDPNNFPIETIVILLGRSGRWTQKILKPLIEVTDDDISGLLIPACWASYLNPRTVARSSVEYTDIINDGGDYILQSEPHSDWAGSIIHAIESRQSMVHPAQFRQELDLIRQCVQRMEHSLSNQAVYTPIGRALCVPVSRRTTPGHAFQNKTF